MKTRAHHNTDGRVQIRSGRTERAVERIARKLRVPFEAKGASAEQRKKSAQGAIIAQRGAQKARIRGV